MVATADTTSLYSLPNEASHYTRPTMSHKQDALFQLTRRLLQIIAQILTPLTTRTLLPLASVSHRFHAIIRRILRYRLILASSLKDYKIILECFHPASKLTDPHFFCTYLGTRGWSESPEDPNSLHQGYKASESLGSLSSVYSYFRPELSDGHDERWGQEQWSPMLVPVSDDHADDDGQQSREATRSAARLVRKQINLDGFDCFSQLCTVVNLVKVVPNSTRLLSAITLEDGVVRLWRDWLKQRAKETRTESTIHDNKKKDDATYDDDPSILWVGLKRNVGLKLRVKEKRWNRQTLPILMHRDEEKEAVYEVEIEEMRIRTTRLLMAIEQSSAEQKEHPNAVIIRSDHVFPPS